MGTISFSLGSMTGFKGCHAALLWGACHPPHRSVSEGGEGLRLCPWIEYKCCLQKKVKGGTLFLYVAQAKGRGVVPETDQREDSAKRWHNSPPPGKPVPLRHEIVPFPCFLS